MKKRVLLFLLLVTAITAAYTQEIPHYPIPSFNAVVTGSACFEEITLQALNLTDGKRVIHAIANSSGKTRSYEVSIWFYSLDQQDVIGPFHVNCGIEVNAEIDQREWGALVQADIPVDVDIWITEETDSCPLRFASSLK